MSPHRLLLVLFTKNVVLYSDHLFIDMLSIYNQTPNDTFEAASIVYLQQELCFRSGAMGIYNMQDCVAEEL